jgi:DNA-binding transcriptional regulator YiaG
MPSRMTPAQFNRGLEVLGLSQAGFARIVGVTDRQCRRWISGENPLPPTAVKLVRLMLAGKVTAEDVERA